MSALAVLGVAALGGLGAVCRFLLDGAVSGRAGRDFPYGTLAVNLLGSFLLGVVVTLSLSSNEYRVVATGLLGSFTTFSTWALESHRLGEDGRGRLTVLNFVLSLALGVTAVWAGRRLGVTL